MVLIAVSIWEALRLYDSLAVGWSWDLAYYNQWFWALTRGDGILSVRPIGPWAQEGPSIWVMNYLAPVRLLIAPIYALVADPRTLVVVQVVVVWLVVPAAYLLVKAESGRGDVAVSAAILVPMLPLLGPLALNDFRELQLAIPFIVIAAHGVRGRSRAWTWVGIAGLLACRQEFAVIVASLALLPARDPELASTRVRWMIGLWMVGICWFLLAFLGFSRWCVNSYAWNSTLSVSGSRIGLLMRSRTMLGLVCVGMGGWALLAVLAPRALLLAFPWIWQVAGGIFGMRQLGLEEWHHVRYTAPAVGMILVAGCIGYGGLARRLWTRPRGPASIAGVWLLAFAGCLAAGFTVAAMLSRVPHPVEPTEVPELQRWMAEVGPEDGVLAHYDLCAPLSSRRWLFSYVLDQNLPPGAPRLAREIVWTFYRKGEAPPGVMESEGFDRVHAGPGFEVYKRDPAKVARLATVPSLLDRPKTASRSGVELRNTNDYAGQVFLIVFAVLETAAFALPAVLVLLWLRRRQSRSVQGQSGIEAGHSSEINGQTLATKLLDEAGCPGLPIVVSDEIPTNLYDAPTRTLCLSNVVAQGTDPRSLALARRETSWAIRHAQGGLLPLVRCWVVCATWLATLLGLVLVASSLLITSWAEARLGFAVLSTSLMVGVPTLIWLDRLHPGLPPSLALTSRHTSQSGERGVSTP